MHRFLILGYGGMGAWHASHLKNSGIACVAGVYDTDPKKRDLAREHGYPVFDSMESLLACDADMAVAAVPNDCHKSLSCDLLASGRHVLVEKPAALSEKELVSMYEAAEKAGKLLAVHQNRRYDRDFSAIRDVLSKSELGEPIRLESRIHGSRGVPQGWRREKARGGGMLYDWGSHLIDQALLAFQDSAPESVCCNMSHVLEDEIDDGFFLILNFSDGKQAFIEVGTCNFIAMPRFYLCCRKGSAIIYDWREPCHVTKCTAFREEDVLPAVHGSGISKTMAPRDELTTKSFLVEPPPVDRYGLLRNFCAAAEGKESLSITKEQTLCVMRVIDAAFRSSETGRPEKIGSSQAG